MILLVLAMLLLVPYFQLAEYINHYHPGPQFALDSLDRHFHAYEQQQVEINKLVTENPNTSPSQQQQMEKRKKELKRLYDRELLRFLYVMNTNMEPGTDCEASLCANTFLVSVLWIGYSHNKNLESIGTDAHITEYVREAELDQLSTDGESWDAWFIYIVFIYFIENF